MPFLTDGHPLAVKWFDSLKEQVDRRPQVADPTRLSNFLNNFRSDLTWTENQIKSQVQTINQIWPSHIEWNPDIEITNDVVHYLHRFFENYCRRIEFGDLKGKPLNEDLHTAFLNLNIAIHRYEALPRTIPTDPLKPLNQDVVITFKRMNLTPLSPSDYKYFTVEEIFGAVYINYCHSGRHLWEALVSADSMALETNLRPQTHYAPGFRIWFGKSTSPEETERRKQAFKRWLKENEKWVRKNNVDPDSLKAKSPGFGRVGFIDPDFAKHYSQTEIIRRIGKLGFVKAVIL